MLKQTQAATVRAVVGVWLGLAALAGAVTVIWDGSGTPNNGGSWQTLTNWSGDAKPLAADNALLGDVTSGNRVVTVDVVETVNQLTMTQTTVGPTNTLTLNQNLTVSGNANPVVTTTGGGATAPAINVTGGKILTLYNSVAMSPSLGSITLGASAQFLTQMGAGTDWNNSASPTFGAISMAGGSLISLSQQAANSAKTFNGAVNVSGTGVSISSTGTWQIGDTEIMTFNAPVTLAAGANLTVNETKQTYNGGSGQPGITLGADAQMLINNNRNGSSGVVAVNGLTLAAGSGGAGTTKLTIYSGQAYAPTFTGTTDLGTNATLSFTMAAGTDWNNTLSPTFGAINLAGGSLISISQQAANSAKTFNGAINATGAGANISSLYTWQIGSDAMNFNAPVSVTGSGSSLNITERNAATFNGSAGNNALTVAAGASFIGGSTGGTYTFTRPVVVGAGGTVTIGATTASANAVLNGLTLAGGVGTTFTLVTNQSPCAPTFGGTTDLGANSKLILQQPLTVDWNTTFTPTFGAINFAAGAQLLINGSQANSVKTFNGAVSITGAGALISSTYQQWVGSESMVFNAPISVTGAGSSLTVNELGSMAFLGGSGQPGITLGAGATMLANQTANNVTTFTLAGASLAADPATTLTLRSGREFTANITGTLDIGAGAKVILQNTLASSDGNGRSITPTFAAINLGAGSQLLVTSLDNLAIKTFNGPINVTGAGATVTMTSTRWSGANVNVNAPLSVTGAGSTLTWTDSGGVGNVWAFNGGSGQPGITVGAGAQMTVSNLHPNESVQMKITGLTLGADPNTKLTLKGAASIGTVAAPTILDGAVNLGTGSKLVLDFGGAQGTAVLSLPATATVVQDGAAINWNWSATSNNGGTRSFTNAGSWTLQNGASVNFTTTTERAAWVLAGNTTSGTMRVLSGSTLNIQDLTNTGTLELGTNATLAGLGGPIPLTSNAGSVSITGSGAKLVASSGAATFTNNAPSTASFASGSSLTLQFKTGGTGLFNNTGTVTQTGASLILDWNDAVNNNTTAKFTNSGTWTISGASLVNFTRQGVNFGGGFGVAQNNTNSGTMTINDTSVVNFNDLTNTGTVNVGNAGSNVGLGTTQAGPTWTNGTNGVLNVKGTALFGPNANTGGTVTFNNGNGSSTGGQLNVGDGSNILVFSIAGSNAALTNGAGNAMAVAAGATLAMLTNAVGDGHNFYNHTTTITNGGTFNLAGKVQFAPNNVSPTITNTGTLTVGGTAAVIERLVNSRPSNYYATMLNNNAGGTLTGSGTLTYTNSSGNAGVNTLTLTNAGSIVPGTGSGGAFLTTVGGLTFTNAATTFTAGTLAIDIGGVYANPAKFDTLTLNGTGGSLTLTGTNTLNIVPVNGFAPTGTYHILTANSLSGTFSTFQYNGGAAAGIYTVNHTATGVDVVFTALLPTWTAAAPGPWSTGSNWSTGSAPDGIDAQLRFGGTGSNAGVTLDASRTVGHVIFDNQSGINYTVTPSGGAVLTLQVGAPADMADITVSNGAQVIAAPVVMASNTEVATLGGSSSLALTGGLSGGFSLTKSGPGSLQIVGASYTGNTFVNAGTLDFNEPADRSYAGVISGAGALVKSGAGRLTLSGASTNTGGMTVTAGGLRVNGSLAGNVTVNSGAVLSGSGSIAGVISGGGLVSPGASPGILTAASVNGAAGTDFAFEFTSKSSPLYGSPTASLNDVLRLTGATPFTTPLGAGNEIAVYMDFNGFLLADPALKGGFFTDTAADFTGSISAAAFTYYQTDPAGATLFNGLRYSLLRPEFYVQWSTVAESANFGSGSVDGRVLQFQVIPEPASLVLLGLAGLALGRRSRRAARG